MTHYYTIVVVGIFACSVAQLLLKKSANRQHRAPIYEILNIRVIVAYTIIFTSLVVNIWALSHSVQLKDIALLESLGYVFVPLLSWTILREKINPRTLLAIACIIAGIVVFYI